MSRCCHKSILVACLLFTLTAAECALADIYVYTDEEGVSHYTNVPSSNRYELFIREVSVSFSGVLPDYYDEIIQEAAEKYGLSFHLVKAVIRMESNFNPRAVSRAGALGLMQIMPQNLDLLHIEDPFDPYQNIMGGTQYLKYLLDRFDGRLSMALAAYNAGPERVAKHNAVPPIPETQNYVKNVIEYYRRFEKP